MQTGMGTGMTYGKGMTKCLDVVAHEMFHGVTDFTSNLTYFGEPGALNEHFSDVFGILVKQKANNETTRQSDWILGKDIIPGVDAIRSMKSPGLLVEDDQINENNEPIDHYQRRYRGSLDNQGVHKNSGIPNKAFYLAANYLSERANENQEYEHAWKHLGMLWYMTVSFEL